MVTTQTNKNRSMSPVAKKVHQIGYLTAMAIVIGSTIGAGIFFKNRDVLEPTGHNFIFSILAWVIAAFGVIMMAMALIEVASSHKGNASLIGWAQLFTKKWFASFSRQFLLLIFYPLLFFALGTYIVDGITRASGFNFQWWQILIITWALVTWFMFVSFFSLRFSTKVQWFLTGIKFVPIIIVPILAFINYDVANITRTGSAPAGLNGISPALGMIAGIPAIYFAFDGFYTVTSLQTSMKNSKRLGAILAIGIAIIAGIYLLLSISLFGSSNGAVSGLNLGGEAGKRWIIAIYSFIVLAVVGVLSGYSLGAHRVYEEEISISKSFSASWIRRLRFKKVTAGFVVSYGLTVLYIVIFGLIGTFAYDSAMFSVNFSSGTPDPNPPSPLTLNLNGFVGIITNWISLISFAIITTSILGAIVNRRTKRVVVGQRVKFFIVFAVIAAVLVYVPVIYMVITPIIDLAGVNQEKIVAAGLLENWRRLNIVKLSVLIGTIVMSLLPYVSRSIYDRIKSRSSLKPSLR